MGDMTLSQFRDAAVYHVGEVSTNRIGTTERTRAVNQAYLHVTQPSIFQHRSLMVSVGIALVTDTLVYGIDETTIAALSTQSTNFASNRFYSVTQVQYFDSSTWPLPVTARREQLIPLTHFDMDSETVRTTGEPRAYTIWGQNIEIDTIPTSNENGNYLLAKGFGQPGLLTADGNVTVLDAVWDDIIVVGAAYRLARAMRHFDTAVQLKEEFARAIADVEDYEATELENPNTMFTVAASGDSMRL